MMTAPIADAPPSGAYAVGMSVPVISKWVFAVFAVVALATVGVLITTTQGAEPTVASNSLEAVDTSMSPTLSPTLNPTSSPAIAITSSPTMVTTSSPTTSKTTLSPTMVTTSSPTIATTSSPTIATTSSPTIATLTPTSLAPTSLAPTYSPSFEPTTPVPTRRSPPTRSPQAAWPTLQPTNRNVPSTSSPSMDPDVVDTITRCVQDIMFYIDASNSIGNGEIAREKAFLRTLISTVFDPALDLNETIVTPDNIRDVRVSVHSFNTYLTQYVDFDSPMSDDPEKLLEHFSNDTIWEDRQYGTNLGAVFRSVTGVAGETIVDPDVVPNVDRFGVRQGRPEGVRFNPITGAGLSVMILTDGLPVLNRGDYPVAYKNPSVYAMEMMKDLLQVMPLVKIYCFSPSRLGKNNRNFFQAACNGGFWQISSATEDDASYRSAIIASKICNKQNEA